MIQGTQTFVRPEASFDRLRTRAADAERAARQNVSAINWPIALWTASRASIGFADSVR